MLDQLLIRDQMTFALAAAPYTYPARRVSRMYDLGYTETTFWARVNELLDEQVPEAEMPEVVHRLKRLREARRAQRAGRRAA